MKITIKKTGVLATVQDLGRFTHRSQAVPVSGAMDSLSAQIANKAVGNDDSCAVIEFNQSGAAFSAESDLLIAMSGNGAYLSAGNQRLPSDRALFIPAGLTLYLENNRYGSRSYLAVAGGWDVPEVLGSRSTHLSAKIGGLNGRSLKENDQLTHTGKLTALTQAILDTLRGDKINYANWSIAQNLFLPKERNVIRIVRGREFDWFDEASNNIFLSQTYTIGHNSNRMGFHLQGPLLHRTIEGELLSTAVTPGTIQVTGGGELILLMADCQTTGGYPRIARVAAVDLPLCAQLKPGNAITFKEIGWREAEKLYIKYDEDLQKVSFAIKQKYISD